MCQRVNVAFNDVSVISRRRLVATVGLLSPHDFRLAVSYGLCSVLRPQLWMDRIISDTF